MTTILVAGDEPPIPELIRFTREDDQGRGGRAVCRRRRQDPAMAGSRIVMLTAASQEADRVRGLAAGADGYLTKPFSPLALFSLVRSLLPEAASRPAMRCWPRRCPMQ